ncbi:mandelate racemase/muconate lactonizing enzyme family protein [Draconibacterium halophilum]|uniref:Dipeptide epimerase n=1 Tax=Draconibacterium halophilum TaxID=2706887 RepID=A0A6C0RCV6_9BACT|nr:dipeptide epimerase [Draconibacterium halophilum]QIA07866.1 dipeptide epimerase [Draconibacterium halophilum]
MNLTIDKIDIYQSPIKLKEPFVISLGPMYHAQNVIVVIHTNQGITGFGECSPFMTINGESMETCFVVGQYLAKVLKGKNPEDIESCTHVMDKTIYGNSSIKSAFDMALYDISAQKAGVPLYQFLGGQNNKEMQIDYTVSLTYPEKMAADAKRIVDNGFEIVKVKLGHSKEQDVESIKRIRETIGPKIPIRLDANQGWKTEEALDILKALTPYKIQHCEEPIPRWDYMKLPDIRRFSPIPIMADETCCDHIDAKRLIDINACDLINIKLSKSGGIFKALKITNYAKAAKMEIQVGGFLETRLGFTAAAHFALSSRNIVYYDFDTPLMMEEDPVEGGILYGEKGKITIPEIPGLGASINEYFLLGLKKISI